MIRIEVRRSNKGVSVTNSIIFCIALSNVVRDDLIYLTSEKSKQDINKHQRTRKSQ